MNLADVRSAPRFGIPQAFRYAFGHIGVDPGKGARHIHQCPGGTAHVGFARMLWQKGEDDHRMSGRTAPGPQSG